MSTARWVLRTAKAWVQRQKAMWQAESSTGEGRSVLGGCRARCRCRVENQAHGASALSSVLRSARYEVLRKLLEGTC